MSEEEFSVKAEKKKIREMRRKSRYLGAGTASAEKQSWDEFDRQLRATSKANPIAFAVGNTKTKVNQTAVPYEPTPRGLLPAFHRAGPVAGRSLAPGGYYPIVAANDARHMKEARQSMSRNEPKAERAFSDLRQVERTASKLGVSDEKAAGIYVKNKGRQALRNTAHGTYLNNEINMRGSAGDHDMLELKELKDMSPEMGSEEIQKRKKMLKSDTVTRIQYSSPLDRPHKTRLHKARFRTLPSLLGLGIGAASRRAIGDRVDREGS